MYYIKIKNPYFTLSRIKLHINYILHINYYTYKIFHYMCALLKYIKKRIHPRIFEDINCVVKPFNFH